MALLWALLALVAGVLMLVLWPFERAPRVTGWVRDARGTPQPLPEYQRDEGDENKDFATEGLDAVTGRRHHSPVSDPRLWSVADLKLFQECERGIHT